MKTIEDIRLEDKISEMIAATFDDLTIRYPDGEYASHSDIADLSEALAVDIIKTVKEAA
jgi:hypothetical protein